MQFVKDLSLPAFTAGLVAVLVGFTSSVAIVFQAALSFGATPAQITSWIWALGLGMGLCTLVPSLLLRKPVMVAWSTPGAAVLAVAGGGFSMGEAVGAFMLCAALITLCGLTGWFEKLMHRIPMAIASALLAGVLARFALQGFSAAQTALPLVLLMLVAYLVSKRLVPRYAVPITLLIAIIYAAAYAQLNWASTPFSLAMPVFTAPVWKFESGHQPGTALVRGHHGLTKSAGRGGDSRGGL
jgi:benzoate membrane transport protein